MYVTHSLKEGWQWAPDNWELEEMMRTEMVRRFQEMSPADDQYPLYLRVMSSVLRPLRTVQESLKRRNVSVPVELRWSSADSALQSGALNRVVGSLWSELQTCSFSKAHDFADPLVLAIQNDGDEIPAGCVELFGLILCALTVISAFLYLLQQDQLCFISNTVRSGIPSTRHFSLYSATRTVLN